MKLYKNIPELEKMNNYELIVYNRFLQSEPQRIRAEIDDVNQCWRRTQALLRDRIEGLELDMMELEDMRLRDDTPYGENYLYLQ